MLSQQGAQLVAGLVCLVVVLIGPAWRVWRDIRDSDRSGGHKDV